MKKWDFILYTAAYNVEQSISELLDRFQSNNVNIKSLIIVNDASTDNTLALIKNKMKNIPAIKLINKKKNEGPVAALFYGMKEVERVIDNPEKTIVIRMDSDLEHQPEDIEKLTKPIISGETRISVGYIPFDSRSGDKMKKFNEKTGIEQSSNFLNMGIPQFCPGFIAMRADLFLKIHPLLAGKAEVFRKKYGEDMLSMDFVTLVIAKKLGEHLVAVKLSSIEDKYIKKQPEEKLNHYLDCHKKTMEFLETS